MRPGSDSMFCAPWKVTDLFPMESQIHHPETTCSWWYRHTVLSLQKVPGFGGCLPNESSNALWEQSTSLQELAPSERVSTGLMASDIALDPGSIQEPKVKAEVHTRASINLLPPLPLLQTQEVSKGWLPLKTPSPSYALYQWRFLVTMTKYRAEQLKREKFGFYTASQKDQSIGELRGNIKAGRDCGRGS